MANDIAVIVLAAGEGTRMKSQTPKVLHPLAGNPLARWVLDAVRGLKPRRICFIVGHGASAVTAELAGEGLLFVEQRKQLGSGHALLQAAPRFQGFRGEIVVLCADTPLISAATLKELVRRHRRDGNAATVLTTEFENPFGYGRIIRGPGGAIERIVEEKDATADERRVREINSGIYCFSSPDVWSALKEIRPNNVKKEYYLTDAIDILKRRGRRTGACLHAKSEEILGINTRLDLARAEALVRRAVLEELMLSGVTVTDPAHTYVAPGTKIGRDTVIHPGTVITGATVVGEGCVIGPNTIIEDSRLGNGVKVRASVVTEARIADDVSVGPFAHLRPGAVLKAKARVGNFSEVKKSVVGEGSKVNHLSYIGDATLGAGVNVGAGTITCNYDGARKHRTVIGARVFVGSNVNLVAPVKVGKGALLGAGSTITDNVPAKALAIARARQVNKKR